MWALLCVVFFLDQETPLIPKSPNSLDQVKYYTNAIELGITHSNGYKETIAQRIKSCTGIADVLKTLTEPANYTAAEFLTSSELNTVRTISGLQMHSLDNGRFQ